LRVEHLAAKFVTGKHLAARGEKKPFAGLRDAIADLEKQMIAQALEKFHGNKSQMARALGLSRLGLHRKMERLGFFERWNAP
jgi:DNA-binding NtrC family response regulator